MHEKKTMHVNLLVLYNQYKKKLFTQMPTQNYFLYLDTTSYIGSYKMLSSS